jgi:hypothetical protein
MKINPNSGQVEIISPFGRVYLYTHDLARMIFCEMIPEELWNSDTGFGIGTQLYVDTELLISLDIASQKITVSSGMHDFDNFSMSFENFIVDFLKDAKL